MAEISTILGVAFWGGLVGLLLLAAGHVWYAAGLSRVLNANGGDGWRAWVPLLGDAEVLRLGRIDPVKVTLLLVPFVAVYGVVLRGIAAHRINRSVGRGAGTTVLAVLLPPVWAMVLADAEPVRGESDVDGADDDAAVVLRAGTLAPAAPTPAAPPALAAPTAAAASLPPTAQPPLAVASAVAQTGTPVAVAAPVPVPPTPSGPITAGLAAPVDQVADAAPAPAASVAAPVSAALNDADAPAEATALRRRSRSEAPAESGIQPPSDETSIAQGPREWELVLPSGVVLPVTARTLVLGRKPQSRRGAAQYVTVDDDSRTVSKEHAQLQWVDEGWTISDLGSVNGIALVGENVAEARLAAGESARVTGGFLLGDARLQLRRTGGA